MGYIIHTWGYLTVAYAKMLNHRILSKDEEEKLVKESQNGCLVSREKLLVHNMRFIAHICRGYANENLNEEDLYSNAIEGFLYSITKFNPVEFPNIKLTTFAFLQIHRHISVSELLNDSCIRIPRELHIAYSKFKKILQDKPELANLDNVSIAKVLVKETGLSYKMAFFVVTGFENINNVFSLDSKRLIKDNDEQREVKNYDYNIVPLNGDTDFTIDFSNEESVESLLSILNDDEREIVEMRFGINRPAESLHSASKRFGKTHQRLSQIYNSAIAKLKKHAELNGGKESYL